MDVIKGIQEDRIKGLQINYEHTGVLRIGDQFVIQVEKDRTTLSAPHLILDTQHLTLPEYYNYFIFSGMISISLWGCYFLRLI